MLTPKLQLLQRTLKRLMRRAATQPLEKVLSKTHAADLGFLLEHFSEHERTLLIEHCPDDEKRAEVLAAAVDELAAEVIATLDRDQAVEVLHQLEPDDASDILQQLPEELSEDLLQRMRGDAVSEVEDLARYESTTAGGIMSPRFFALHRDTTARSAIEHLQRVSDELEMVFYVYIVNEIDQLLGVVSLRQLVTTKPTTTMFELMTSEMVSVRPEVDQEEVAKLASRYGLLAVPVVDETNKLLGIVTVDDVIDVLREEATEDILRMAGAGDQLGEQQTVFRALWQRSPWLLLVGAGGVVGAALLDSYARYMANFIPPLCLVPFVLGLSGMSGLQGATVIAQNLTYGRGGLARVVLRQSAISLLQGVLFGLVTAALYGFWLLRDAAALSCDPQIAALAIGGAITAALASAGLVGAFLPLLFGRIKLDPAVAAGPAGAVAVDLVALIVFLALSTICL